MRETSWSSSTIASASFASCQEELCFPQHYGRWIDRIRKAVSLESIDLGGYYHPDREKAVRAMRSSAVLNSALAQLTD